MNGLINLTNLAGGRLFFVFRPLNGKQNINHSLRPLRLCGEKKHENGDSGDT
jgi:hypothetical protein